MDNRILETPVWEIANKIALHEIMSEEYVATTLERIKKVDSNINSYITILEESALAKAREVDKRIQRGEKPGILAGLPVAIKDNICVKNVKTTCASRMLNNFIAPYDSTVVKKIKNEDGIIIGKTNLDEFAMGSSTEHSYFGPTRNPWDPERVPGGSSGGSAAAVAGLEAAFALGSDTGGSVRSPASFCAVVGLKPTYGAVSRYGLISYANSLEQIGPIARDVRSCALLMDAINGHDSRDSTSSDKLPQRFRMCFNENPIGLRVGIPRELFEEGVHKVVVEKAWDVIKMLEGLGLRYEEISLPMVKYALPTYYIIAMSEASSNLARYDGLRYGFRIPDRYLNWNTVYSKNRKRGFGTEVRRRIMLGTYVLSAGYFEQYYLKAQKIRTLIKKEFNVAFNKFDILVAPSMPVLPFKLGEKLRDSLELYMCDVDTVPANLTGIPSISVPCGLHQGLPIGLQIMARHFREDILFRTAQLIEENISIERTMGQFTHV